MTWLQATLDKIGTSDIIAFVLVGVSSYLWIATGDIPESLLVMTTTIVGFFFADKRSQHQFAASEEAANPKPAPPYIADEQD